MSEAPAALPVHYRALVAAVAPAAPWPRRTIAYGAGPIQVADLRQPAGGGPHPMAVVIHGGFWSVPWDRRLMNAICDRLAREGIGSWNIEYRSLGGGGGWPATFEDVRAATDHLAVVAATAAVDLDRVVTVGHSAGGQLALWLAGGGAAGATAPPSVRIAAAVGIAPVCDLRAGQARRVGGDVIGELLGGLPDEVPDRYRTVSPNELLPLGVPQLLIHGDRDDLVPLWQSRDHALAAAEAGDDVVLEVLADTDHMAPLFAGHELDAVPEWIMTNTAAAHRHG